MEFRYRGPVVEWRGPSPYHYVAVPEQDSTEVRELAATVSYGWGAVPVEATIGGTTFRTSLFPKDGRYLLPLRDAVRRAEALALGDEVEVVMRLREP